MKKIFFIIPLALSITAMGCSDNSENTATEETTIQATAPEQQSAEVNKDVNVDEFAKLIAKGEGQVLDVRTPAEWENGTIDGAIKINFFDKDFQAQLEKLDKTKPIYVYCKSGGRSGKAAKQMQKMGFKTVYNLLGGITAWNAAGKETVK